MIPIHRPTTIPEVLQRRGKAAQTRCCRKHDAGEDNLTFDGRIYGHKQVKTILEAMQHGKCAYCEAKLADEIDHFRPTSQYYWLAYEWVNLLLSCGSCNVTKSDKFPLADESQKAQNHHHDVTRETPLLINPAMENPTLLIGWRGEIAFPINGDERAEKTIEVLGLNSRNQLVNARRARLAKLARLAVMLEEAMEYPDDAKMRNQVKKIREYLVGEQAASEDFAAMVQSALAPLSLEKEEQGG